MKAGTRRWAALLLSAFVLKAVPSVAQEEIRVTPSPFYIKYGKFLLLGLSAGMSIKAAHVHGQAEDAFNDLENYCFQPGTSCVIGGNGAYLDPIAEDLYQTSVSYDKEARNWLYAGEATLIASATFFIWELTRPKNPPKNIPFEPQVTVVGTQTRLGFRVGF